MRSITVSGPIANKPDSRIEAASTSIARANQVNIAIGRSLS